MKNILNIIKLSKPKHKWIILSAALITIQAALMQAMLKLHKIVIQDLEEAYESC